MLRPYKDNTIMEAKMPARVRGRGSLSDYSTTQELRRPAQKDQVSRLLLRATFDVPILIPLMPEFRKKLTQPIE